MNDFTILHLSDLHFNVKNNILPTLMNNLLDDIADQVKFIDNNIIIVVTGDLIHKGNYEYEASVLKFFRALSKIIGDKFQDIYIVPGNHDKERNAIDKMILEKYVFTENDSIARKFKAKYWQYISYAFNKHLKLVEKIYKIFYKKNHYSHYDIVSGIRCCLSGFPDYSRGCGNIHSGNRSNSRKGGTASGRTGT